MQSMDQFSFYFLFCLFFYFLFFNSFSLRSCFSIIVLLDSNTSFIHRSGFSSSMSVGERGKSDNHRNGKGGSFKGVLWFLIFHFIFVFVFFSFFNGPGFTSLAISVK
jgi:hypothetical protein